MVHEWFAHQPDPGSFLVAGWAVDPASGQISRGQTTLRLRPRVMDLLVAFLHRPGEVLSKVVLFDAVWPDSVVCEASLSVAISQLRSALGDDPANPTIIETIPRRGYRLIADVIGPRLTGAARVSDPGIREPMDPGSLSESLFTHFRRPVFVARNAELTKLHKILAGPLTSRGGVAFITGEAGTGKTALLTEFVRRTQSSRQTLVVATSRCSAQNGLYDPYGPFRQLLGSLTGDLQGGFLPGFPTQEYLQRLRQIAPTAIETIIDSATDLVGTLLPGRPLLARAQGLLANGASWLDRLHSIIQLREAVPPDASLQHAAIFSQVTSVFQAVAESGPLVLAVEDLHWADAGSIDLLFHLCREIGSSPLLILGTYRPSEVALERAQQRHPLLPVVAEATRIYGDTTIELGETADQDFVEAYVDSQPNRLSGNFRERLFRQTGGHALFTVESLRAMTERGDLIEDSTGYWTEGVDLDWGSLPARVGGVIGERFGRLREELLELLRIASVEGPEFTTEVLAQVGGIEIEKVIQMLSRELAHRHRLVEALGVKDLATGRASIYGFSHSLFQAYLYESLDEIEKTHLHHKVGIAMEGVYGNDIAPHKLAMQFERAAITEKAILYWQRASDQAKRLTANVAAISHLNRALALVSRLPESQDRHKTEMALQVSLEAPLAATHGWASPNIWRSAERALQLAEVIGDDSEIIPALFQLTTFHAASGQLVKAIDIGEHMLRLADQRGDSVQLAMAHWGLGFLKYLRGQVREARVHIEHVIDFYDPQKHHWLAYLCGQDLGAVSRAHLSVIQCLQGQLDQAVQSLKQATALTERLGHPFSDTFARSIIFAYVVSGKYREAQMEVDRFAAAADQHGFLVFRTWVPFCRGQLFFHQGKISEGVRLMGEGIEAYKKTGVKNFLTYALDSYGAGLCAAGNHREALQVFEEALDLVADLGEELVLPELWRHKGLALLELSREGDAEECFLEASEVAKRNEMKLWELTSATSICHLWRDQGRLDDARELLTPVVNWFTEGFDTPPLQEANLLLNTLH